MNNVTKKTITIYQDYEKISLLEYYINNDKTLESLISIFIDYYINKNYSLAEETFQLIKNKINDINLFYKIIKITLSIANQSPLNIDLDDTYKIYSKL
jgi:hypothetical protein